MEGYLAVIAKAEVADGIRKILGETRGHLSGIDVVTGVTGQELLESPRIGSPIVLLDIHYQGPLLQFDEASHARMFQAGIETVRAKGGDAEFYASLDNSCPDGYFNTMPFMAAAVGKFGIIPLRQNPYGATHNVFFNHAFDKIAEGRVIRPLTGLHLMEVPVAAGPLRDPREIQIFTSSIDSALAAYGGRDRFVRDE